MCPLGGSSCTPSASATLLFCCLAVAFFFAAALPKLLPIYCHRYTYLPLRVVLAPLFFYLLVPPTPKMASRKMRAAYLENLAQMEGGGIN